MNTMIIEKEVNAILDEFAPKDESIEGLALIVVRELSVFYLTKTILQYGMVILETIREWQKKHNR